MSDAPKTFALLHIFGQPMWHGEAVIAGNRVALMGLRSAIDEALSAPERSSCIAAISEDGEGYWTVIVQVGEDDWDGSENGIEIGCQYTDEAAGPPAMSDEIDRRVTEAISRKIAA